MNTYSKPAIIALVSLGVGGVAGFLVARRLLEQHYQELSQMEIDDVKDYYRKKYENKEPVVKDETGEYKKIATKYAKPDLHELASGETREIAEDDEDLEEDEDELEYDDMNEDGVIISPIETADSLDPNKDPYRIDYDTYIKPTDIFSKVDLYYYRFDDVICDANDVIKHSPEDILGWEWMKDLETKTTAFVRNEATATDYEIHSFSKSYKDEVASRLETDKEKKYRRIARKKEAMDSSSDEILEYEREIKKKTPRIRKSKEATGSIEK